MIGVRIFEVGTDQSFLLDPSTFETPEIEARKFLEVFPDGGEELKAMIVGSECLEDFELGEYPGYQKFLKECPFKECNMEEYVEVLHFTIWMNAQEAIEAIRDAHNLLVCLLLNEMFSQF